MNEMRSTYGLKFNGSLPKTYVAQVVCYDPVKGQPAMKTLRHKPFRTAMLALRYATLVHTRYARWLANTEVKAV